MNRQTIHRAGPTVLLLSAAALLGGCSFAKRSPKMYADDTKALLETRHDQVKACYEAELKSDVALAGSVTIAFKVAEDTGKVTQVQAEDGSSLPESLQSCVVQSVEGLTLMPPDADEGHATFTYRFNPGPRPPAQ